MITVAIVAALVAVLYWYGTRTFDYWKKRGVKHDKPYPFLGTNAAAALMQRSMTQLAVDQYQKYPNERVVGFYRSTQPELLIRDPELIKRILLTDFYHFHYRGLALHKTVLEPLMRNLFIADGDIWRLLRQRITPAFTSSKLKAMFPLIVERAEKLQARVLSAASAARPLDARDLMARYTTDFIGACAFGLDADSLNEEDSAFRKLGIAIFKVDVMLALKLLMKQMFPELCKHVTIIDPQCDKAMKEIIGGILKQRNYQPSNRNDFIDLLLELQKKGTMVAESLQHTKPDGTPELAKMELTEELFAAQVFVFFAAGFETSSSATSFTLHQLAYHPEAQRKVQEEVDRVLAKHGNKLSYDAIKEMTYLECAFKEGMRLFPSLGFLYRECARKYTFTDLKFSVDEGVKILIPVQALHMDPAYFPEPHEFRPERFLPDTFDAQKYKYVYLPFGEGPRACIGERLGHMQSLAGLAAVLARFGVAPAHNTQRRPRVDEKSHLVQSVKHGLPLLFTAR